jgi:prepilin-type N-terminal cleavage/methylation domain-containing protein
MRQHHCQGFNLIEMAIVLGVVGLVMGGVWTVVQKVQQTTHLRQASEQIITINKNVRAYYQTRSCIANGDQTGALTAATVVPPVFPREMLAAGGVVHPWNGAVTVSGTNAGCDYQYTLTLAGLPGGTCVELVPQLTGASEPSRGLISATINGLQLAALPPNPTDIVGNAAGQCNENAAAILALTYKLRVAD